MSIITDRTLLIQSTWIFIFRRTETKIPVHNLIWAKERKEQRRHKTDSYFVYCNISFYLVTF